MWWYNISLSFGQTGVKLDLKDLIGSDKINFARLIGVSEHLTDPVWCGWSTAIRLSFPQKQQQDDETLKTNYTEVPTEG